jgi:hypothetical protein
MAAHGLCTAGAILDSIVMPDLAELVPQNGHGTANPAVPPWQLDEAQHLPPLDLTANQQVLHFWEHFPHWHAHCTTPRVE